MMTMEDRLKFVWEKFIDEPRGAVQQITAFIGDLGFFDPLLNEFTEREILYIIEADTNLRMPPKMKNSPFAPKSILEDFTIDLED